MSIGAAIGGVASLGSALIGSSAAKKAAKAQAAAAQAGIDLTRQMYEQGRTDLAPYRDIGNNALGTISGLYGYGTNGSAGTGTPDYSAFTNSPDYNFAYQQGLKALDNSAASKGLLLSGGQVKDAQTFGQGLASQQYGNYFNRLMGLATMGQGAATASMQGAQNTASSLSNLYQQQGQATASGYVGSANALSGGLQNGLLSYALLGGKSGYGSLAGGSSSGGSLSGNWWNG